jgi:DNA polymerase-3 subunit epsilon
MTYTAIDFETANSYPGGGASVALVRFDQDGLKREEFYTLLRPKHRYFDPGMTAVHKLNEDECLASDEFDAVWPRMREFIGGDLLVAHNAVFDMGVLKGSFEAYDLEVKEMNHLCTLTIARRLWPNLLSYKLAYLIDYFGMEYNAHHALDDASMCGKIFHKQCSGYLDSMFSLRRFLIKYKIEPKVIVHHRTGGDFFL